MYFNQIMVQLHTTINTTLPLVFAVQQNLNKSNVSKSNFRYLKEIS